MSNVNFEAMCEAAERFMRAEIDGTDRALPEAVDLQKRAMIGYAAEVETIKKSAIASLLDAGFDCENAPFPPWYASLADAVFHEVWGLAGLAQWFSDEWRGSSSAKVIGDRIYFLADGVMKLMPQRLSSERRDQLIRALLLLAPDERQDKAFHEVYMLDGTRVTIFRNSLVKDGLDSIILRRYIVPTYSFEEQALRGTIPESAVPLFESMVRLGANVVFCGSVRSAKTTFLSTWQSYEDPRLEGVMVETDPEIPMHRLMPEAPIVQLIADGDALSGIAKNLMRSDADYFILAEARDGIALDTAVRLAQRGTRRMKMTFHLRDPQMFAAEAATEIVRCVGGDSVETRLRAASGFDYVFHFAGLRGTSKKKLMAIYEIGVRNRECYADQLCAYDTRTDSWHWTFRLEDEKRRQFACENAEALSDFERELKKLAEGVGTVC